MFCNIIVARYNEDYDKIGWIWDYDGDSCVKVYLYEKGTPIDRDPKNISLVHKKLPNVGRESHTYLTHIIKNYDKILQEKDAVTVFTQAGIQDHISRVKPRDFIHGISKEALEKGFSESVARAQPGCNKEHQPSPNFRIKEWPPGTPLSLNKADETFEEWFERCLGQRFPPISQFRWVLGGIFAVKNETIAQFPITYYEKLCAELGEESNSEVGHFFERSWYYIFKKTPLYISDLVHLEDIQINSGYGPTILLVQIDTRDLPPKEVLAPNYTFPRGDLTINASIIRNEYIKTNYLDEIENTTHRKRDRHRRAIRSVSSPTDEQQIQNSYYVLTSVMNKLQCSQHKMIDYRYKLVTSINGRHASWTKYKTLTDSWDEWKKYDIVVVIDTDAWIRDIHEFYKWMSAFYQMMDKTLFYSGEPYCTDTFRLDNIQQIVNGGFTALKPNDYALRALQEIYDFPDRYSSYSRYKTEWSFEQICISHKICMDSTFRDSIVYGPTNKFNTPAGSIVCHCWWKELIEPMILDEIKAFVLYSMDQ